MNSWILYFIYLTFIPITNNTYSCVNDIEKISNSITAADRFNINDPNSNNHDKEGKDNSGIGNGPEPGDNGQNGDPDNPGKGNGDKKEDINDDHPKAQTEINNDHNPKDDVKEVQENSGIENGPEPSVGEQNGEPDNPEIGNGDKKEDINDDQPMVQPEIILNEDIDKMDLIKEE
jgi:hypothetical protein